MLTNKHFHLPQVIILPFSNIKRGNGGVGAHSVGITVRISCFLRTFQHSLSMVVAPYVMPFSVEST